MKWSNLKLNKCPKCGESLEDAFDKAANLYICICGFRISGRRFKEIVNSRVIRDIEVHYRPEDEEPEPIL